MKYLKLSFFWLIGTFAIYILIATSIMFSRITTLEAVKVFEFKMYIEALQNIEIDKVINVIKIANVLSIKNKDGEFIRNFFPIAIITEQNCIENGAQNSDICTKFRNIYEVENFISNSENHSYYKELIYQFDEDRTLIHRKINENLHIVGLTGKYLDSEKRTFVKFISNDWHNYFLKFDKGNSGQEGLKTTWSKSQEAFYIIFLISLIFLLIVVLYQVRNKQKFNKLKETLNFETRKIEKLNEEYDEISYQKQILEEEKDNQSNKEQVVFELNKELEKLKEEIRLVGEKENNIFDKIRKQSNHLSAETKSEELIKSINEVQAIKQLWSRESKWNNRLDLESNITTEITNIPFTLTIAFILFENQFIERYAKKSAYYDLVTNLEKKIDLVCQENELPSSVKEKFHEIRRARNKWFHYGKKPDSKIISDLLSVLDQYKITADILI